MGVFRWGNQHWQQQNITIKFSGLFGILLVLSLVVIAIEYAALTLVQREQQNIISSTGLQIHVLDMELDLAEARRLERDFFLHYPQSSVEQAYQSYALPANDKIAQLTLKSRKLQELVSQPEFSERFPKQATDVNLYSSVADRYAATFTEALDLVELLANDKTGIRVQIDTIAQMLETLLNDSNSPTLIALYQEMRSEEKDFYVSHRRSDSQEAMNVSIQLQDTIIASESLSPVQKQEAIDYLNDYRSTLTEVVRVDDQVQTKLADFDFQANSLAPISVELDTFVTNDVQRSRLQIDRTNRAVSILFLSTGSLGFILFTGIGYMLNQSITRKLVKLTAVVREIRAGNLDVKVSVDSEDELGELAQAFNEMTSRIRQTLGDLEKERDLLARLMKTSPVSIVIADTTGKLTFANEQAEKVLGIQIEAITQRNYNSPEWHQTDFDGNPLPPEAFAFQQAKNTRQPVYNLPVAIKHPNGEHVLLSVSASPLLNSVGEFEGAVVVIEDVTAQRHMEQEIIQRTRELETLLEFSQQLTQETELQPLLDLTINFIQNALPTTEITQIWLHDTSADPAETDNFNQHVGYKTQNLPLVTSDGVIGGLIVAFKEQVENVPATAERLLQSMTSQAAIAFQRAILFKEVREGRDQLRNLSQRILATQEEERRRIARELHDELGQGLLALKLDMQMLQDSVSTRVNQKLAESITLADSLTEEMYRMAMDLRPSVLDHLGLGAAVEWYIQRYRQRSRAEVKLVKKDVEM